MKISVSLLCHRQTYQLFFKIIIYIDCFLQRMELLLFNFITNDFLELLYCLFYHTQEKKILTSDGKVRFVYFLSILSMHHWIGPRNKAVTGWPLQLFKSFFIYFIVCSSRCCNSSWGISRLFFSFLSPC